MRRLSAWIPMSNLLVLAAFGFRSLFLSPAERLPAKPLIPSGKNSQTSLISKIEQAQRGDTIVIDGGFYSDCDIQIDKPLTLIGKNKPTLDGGGKGFVVSIHSDSVTVSGFRVQNSGQSSINDFAGIFVGKSMHVRITDNELINNYFGIYFAGSTDCVVENNHISGLDKKESGSGNGIHLWKCERIQVKKNFVQFHRDGIYFEFVSESAVENNFSTLNKRYGLHFMFSNKNQYRRNTFEKNGSGVAVMYSEEIVMENNHFIENKGAASYGLLLKDIRKAIVKGNHFDGNTVGLLVEECNRSTFEGNHLAMNGKALVIPGSSMDNEFKGNNFLLNSFDLISSSENSQNTFDGNYWDKYEGYDLNKDERGDIPFHPVSLFSYLADKMPMCIFLYRSFTQYLLDRAEKILPSITPGNLMDSKPLMNPAKL